MDSKIGVLAVALVAGLALGMASCGGETNHEKVWLYVFNGYPGAESLSLYGPSGKVTTDLGFGERTEVPIGVNRNLGTDFKLLLEGAPKTFDVELPLYNMYPHETATVFFKRRAGTDNVDDPMLFRHLQTGYRPEARACRLYFDNGLSVKNDAIGTFDYIPVFKIRPSCAGYVKQIGSFDDTGQMVRTPSNDQIEVGRPGLYQQVKNNPWFIPAQADSGQILDIRNEGKPACGLVPKNNRGNGRRKRIAGEDAINWVWAPKADYDFESGSFRAPPPTREYMNCIGWDPDKGPSDQNIKRQQRDKCQMTGNNARLVPLNNELVSYRVSTGIGLTTEGKKVPNNQCGFAVRVMSDFFNVFKEPRRNKTERLVQDIQFGPSQYFFWVLYGRPVNPRVEKWGSNTPKRGGGFQQLPPYPGLQGSTN